jgi:hypothetical protein
MDDDLLPLERGIEIRDDTHLPRVAETERLGRCPVLAARAERALLELFGCRRLDLAARGSRSLRPRRRDRDATAG